MESFVSFIVLSSWVSFGFEAESIMKMILELLEAPDGVVSIVLFSILISFRASNRC